MVSVREADERVGHGRLCKTVVEGASAGAGLGGVIVLAELGYRIWQNGLRR